MPVGQLAYGPLGDAIGYRDLYVGSAIAYAVVVGLVLSSRSVRSLPRRRDVEAEPVPTVT